MPPKKNVRKPTPPRRSTVPPRDPSQTFVPTCPRFTVSECSVIRVSIVTTGPAGETIVTPAVVTTPEGKKVQFHCTSIIPHEGLQSLIDTLRPEYPHVRVLRLEYLSPEGAVLATLDRDMKVPLPPATPLPPGVDLVPVGDGPREMAGEPGAAVNITQVDDDAILTPVNASPFEKAVSIHVAQRTRQVERQSEAMFQQQLEANRMMFAQLAEAARAVIDGTGHYDERTRGLLRDIEGLRSENARLMAQHGLEVANREREHSQTLTRERDAWGLERRQFVADLEEARRKQFVAEDAFRALDLEMKLRKLQHPDTKPDAMEEILEGVVGAFKERLGPKLLEHGGAFLEKLLAAKKLGSGGGGGGGGTGNSGAAAAA